MRSRVTRVAMAALAFLFVVALHAQEFRQEAPRRQRGGRRTPVSHAGASVYFSGTIFYSVSGSSVTIGTDSVTNASGTASGPLRLVLFFSSDRYPAAGSAAAMYEFPAIAGGATVTNIKGKVSYKPPSGCRYVAMLLQEYVGGNWETDDYVTFIVPCALAPDHGPTAGGTSVLISGNDLNRVTTVEFGGAAATIEAKSEKSMTVTTPPHAEGTVWVRFSGGGGNSYSEYTYEPPPPQITGIEPSNGPVEGGQQVTISGKNLDKTTKVTFAERTATIKSKSKTELVVITPKNDAGVVTVTVRTDYAKDTTKYTYGDALPAVQLLPVVGSLAGNLGSFFRTSMQMVNATTSPMSGRIVFHPQGQTFAAAETGMAWSLAPGQTQFIPDILPAMNASGLGSLDLQADAGSALPTSVVRIFNDAGANGTTGMTIDFLESEDALSEGSSGVLLAPANPAAFRFNIGVRALSSGATMTLVVRNAAGSVVRTVPLQFGANSFQQSSANALSGGELQANDSLTFNVTAGSAIVYGSTTDNLTQDPSYQLAKSVPVIGNDTLVVTVVGSAPGNFGSFYRTSTQLHNPLASPIRVRAVFHPQGRSAAASDPATTVTLAAGETKFFNDVVAAVGASGLGSFDVEPLDAALPIVISRIYNDAGAKGTTGMTLDALSPEQALSTGARAVLAAPADPSNFRYNVGIRTVGGAATLLFTLTDATGAVKKTVETSYPAEHFIQVRASDIFGSELAANDAIVIEVRSGNAHIYGSTTDNRTQDPNVQVARAE